MLHLKKHKIDPATIDLDALAPNILPSKPLDQRKFTQQQHQLPSIEDVTPSIVHFGGAAYAYRELFLPLLWAVLLTYSLLLQTPLR